MNILIANDDGYDAKGIRTLARRLAIQHDVVVVAPDGERSGYSHQVHFYGGITYRKVFMSDGIPTYAVNGSPADCVIFAVKYLFKDKKFDVVLSGINAGLNIGSDIIYSGTCGAAQEGTFHRIPSIAVSLRTRGTSDYDFSADFIAKNLEKLMSYAVENVTVNVNVPYPTREQIVGVKVAPVSFRPYNENYYSKEDENGKEWFYIEGHSKKDHPREEYGDWALCDNGYITISPIKLFATDEEVLRAMQNAEFKL